jgi:hypothetical protein
MPLQFESRYGETRREVIERVVIIGDMKHRNDVLSELNDGGFIIIRSGPRRTGAGTVDLAQFEFHAERPVEE